MHGSITKKQQRAFDREIARHARKHVRYEERVRRGGIYVLQIDVTGGMVADKYIGRRRRSLTTITKKLAPKNRPFIVSVHPSGTALRPTDDTVRLRKDWSKTKVGPHDVVVITHLPLGGGDNSTLLSIGATIAALALVFFAPYIGIPAFIAKVVALGIVLGASYLASKAAQAKANDNNKQLYGVSGGGNLPRPGDRIPRLYGLCWTQPDLSQQDYFEYDGEDVVLYKRVTLSLGRVNPKIAQIGTATMWTEAGGVQVPFAAPPGGGLSGFIGGGAHPPGSGGGCSVEVIQPGGASTLVPSSVYSSPSVQGAELPRVGDPNPWQGHFRASPVGKPTDKIQLDWTVQGVFHNSTSGQIVAPWNVMFQYAPCDASSNPTGPFVTLHQEGEAARKSTTPLRFTRVKSVAMGDYVVRAQNQEPLVPNRTNPITWDGLRARFNEIIVRPHVTEMAFKIRSGKSLGVTAFGEIWVQAQAVIGTYNGTDWVDAETRKAVYAFRDVLKATYGGSMTDAEVDLETIISRASSLPVGFDTFDGIIRGPISLYEAASTILGVVRAEPARIGRMWSMSRDEQKAARKYVFTRRQITRNTTITEFAIARDDGSADVIGEFSPDGDPRRRRDVRVTFGAPSLTPRRVQWNGVSSWEMAQQLTKWVAVAAYKRRVRRKFGTDRQGRLITRGDPVRIDSWFMSAGKAAGIISRSGNKLTLDTDVSVPADTYCVLRNRRSREWGPLRVTSGGRASTIVLNTADVATIEAFYGESLSQVLANDDEDPTSVLVGPLTELQDPFIVDSVQPQGRDNIVVEGVYDHPDVWSTLGEAPPPEPAIPAPGDELEPNIAVIPWVTARCIQKATSLAMDWAVGRARGADSYVVQLSYDNGVTWEQVSHNVSTSGSHPLRHEEGLTIKVGAYAISKQGNPGPAVYTTFTTFRPTLDNTNSIIDVTAFNAELKVVMSSAKADAYRTAAHSRALIDSLIRTQKEADSREISVRRVEGGLAEVIAGIVTRVDEASAGILHEQITRASASEAFASDLTVVSTALGGHTASISELLSSSIELQSDLSGTQTELDGVQAKISNKWQIVSDINGRITGIYFNDNGTITNVIFLVDNFLIGSPSVASGVDQVVFAVSSVDGTNRFVLNGNAYIQKLLADTIATRELVINGVQFENILAGSATSEDGATHGTINLSTSADVSLVSKAFTIQTNGAGVGLMNYTAKFTGSQSGGTEPAALNVKFFVDGVQQGSTNQIRWAGYGANWGIPFGIGSLEQRVTGLTGGSHTFEIKLQQAAGIGGADNGRLTIKELRR